MTFVGRVDDWVLANTGVMCAIGLSRKREAGENEMSSFLPLSR